MQKLKSPSILNQGIYENVASFQSLKAEKASNLKIVEPPSEQKQLLNQDGKFILI